MIAGKEVYTLNQFADLLSVSKETLRRWDNSGKLKAKRNKINGYRYYTDDHVFACQQLEMFIPLKKEAVNFVKPDNIYKSIELFAGAGGLALGFEKAGIEHILLNEIDNGHVKH